MMHIRGRRDAHVCDLFRSLGWCNLIIMDVQLGVQFCRGNKINNFSTFVYSLTWHSEAINLKSDLTFKTRKYV